MPMPDGPHLEALRAALATEGEAHLGLLAGDEGAPGAMREASRRYRESWESAPPGAYGRLIGMLKAAVIAGDAREEAGYARTQLAGAPDGSAAASYVRAIAALVLEDDEDALAAAAGMRAASPPFDRAAAAITALAERDGPAYADAVDAIVADFEGRGEHLTGVPIADTALMLERLAEARGLAVHPSSSLLPPART